MFGEWGKPKHLQAEQVIMREELETFLAGNHESRRLEANGAGAVRRSNFFVAKAAKAIGNLRDVGLVIGVDDDKIALGQPGLNDVEFAEWSEFDLVTGSTSGRTASSTDVGESAPGR